MTCCKCGRPITDDEDAQIVSVGGFQMIQHAGECPRPGVVSSRESQQMVVVKASVMINDDGEYLIGDENESALEKWENDGNDVSQCTAYYLIDLLVPVPRPARVSATLPPIQNGGGRLVVNVR